MIVSPNNPSTQLAWGILGTGNIARQFAAGVATSRRSRLVAVGSRTEKTAKDFAAAHQIATAHGSYEALLADPQAQAIYLSLPNSMHHEWTLKSLRAGKHVLCEKPFAVDLSQSQEMFDEARRAGLVLVEAFMYRSQPLILEIIEQVRRGAIGQLRLIRSSFCYCTTRVAGNIRFDPALAGGALMDVGCYCISFSRLFAALAGAGEPTVIQAAARMHETGVDEITVGSLLSPGNLVASFTCGMTAHADNTAYLCGSEGFIEIPVPWKPPPRGAVYSIVRATPPRMDLSNSSAKNTPPVPSPRQTFTVDAGIGLYGVEADDFAATVLDGQPPRVSPQDTLGNMRVLDEMRRQIGMKF